MPQQPSKDSPRARLRLAARIHAGILASQRDPPDTWSYALENLADRARSVLLLQRRLRLCQTRGFATAMAKTFTDLADLLRRVPQESDQVIRALPQPHLLPSFRDIAAEVDHLFAEFPDIAYDPKAQTLTLTTDPIVLEDIRLGPFKVVLELTRVREHPRRECYRAIATEPHPAASNDAVTHPHISDGRLCEGDAALPIRAALAEGRLADFFTLVTCVLTTYNPGSPYVPLDNWYGQPCHDCGDTVDEDQRYWCSGCDHVLCESCISSCRSCDDSRCRSCLTDCPECGDPVCRECLTSCSACASRCCRACLDEGQCPPCRESHEQGKIDHEESSSSAPGSPTRKGVRGQAA